MHKAAASGDSYDPHNIEAILGISKAKAKELEEALDEQPPAAPVTAAKVAPAPLAGANSSAKQGIYIYLSI